MGGASFHLQPYRLPGQVRPFLSQFFFNLVTETEIWHLVSQFADFGDQDGGTPLDSDLDEGAGEEATARQVEPVGKEELWWEGSNFHQHQDFEFKHLGI